MAYYKYLYDIVKKQNITKNVYIYVCENSLSTAQMRMNQILKYYYKDSRHIKLEEVEEDEYIANAMINCFDEAWGNGLVLRRPEIVALNVLKQSKNPEVKAGKYREPLLYLYHKLEICAGRRAEVLSQFDDFAFNIYQEYKQNAMIDEIKQSVHEK